MIRPEDLYLESHPSDRDSHFNWTITRASHERPLSLVVLSREVFGIRTHFWANRTCPCVKTNCPACDAGRLSRWTGYLACVNHANWSQVLFEYTPPAAEQLRAILESQGFLRGTKLVAGRTQKRANARVTVVSKGLYEHVDRIPPEPEILPILFHIWGLKEKEPTQSGGYDRQELPLAHQPEQAKKRRLRGSMQSAEEMLTKDLPGQKKLPLAEAK